MLGLLLIYFIGKHFYDLAHEYSRHRWGFALMGIAAYYAGTFLAGLAMGGYDLVSGTTFFTSSAQLSLSLIALPFGLLACWGLHVFLKKKWGAPRHADSGEALDDQFTR